MDIVEYLTPLLGGRQGTNRLRIMPTDAYQESAATAAVSVTAAHFGTIAYTWSDADKAQDGLLLLGGTTADGESKAVWVDSWHTGPAWMDLSGGVGEDGVLRLNGSYSAPTGPDWGWQIHISPAEGRITMHNVVPGHEAYQVVELLTRVAG